METKEKWASCSTERFWVLAVRMVDELILSVLWDA